MRRLRVTSRDSAKGGGGPLKTFPRVKGSRFKVQERGKVQGSKFKVQSSKFKITNSKFSEFQNSEFRIPNFQSHQSHSRLCTLPSCPRTSRHGGGYNNIWSICIYYEEVLGIMLYYYTYIYICIDLKNEKSARYVTMYTILGAIYICAYIKY